MKQDVRTAACLHALTQPEFEPFVAYLKALYKEARDRLEVADADRLMYQCQGKAQLASLLLNDIANARDVLEKLNKR
jgi:hypothetical protein